MPYLLAGQAKAARQAGVEPYLIARELWVMNLSLLDLIGMILKATHDHGIILDAEWQTRLNTAYQGPWPAEVLGQQDPNRAVT